MPFYIWILFIIALFIGLGILIVNLLNKAITFSKISFSLLMAGFANANTPILPNGGFGSYLIWFVIICGAIFLLCFIPRINLAFRFCCTAFMSYFIFFAVSSIITEMFNITTIPNQTLEIIIKVVALAISVKALLGEVNITNLSLFTHPILINLERVIASVMYGFIAAIILINNTTCFSDTVEMIILFGLMILAFIADVVLTKLSRR